MGHSLRAAFGAMALLACCACSKKAKPNAVDPGGSSAPPPVKSAKATAPVASGKAKVPPASKFAVLARADEPFLVSGLGAQALAFPQNFPMRLDGAGIHEEADLLSGIGDPLEMESISAAGSFPDAAFLVTSHAFDDPAEAPQVTIYRWHHTRWLETPRLDPGEMVTSIVPWKGGRYIAVIQLPWTYDYRFALLSGKVPVALPNPGTFKPPPGAPPVDANAHEETYRPCRTPLVPMAAAGLPDGHLFLLGNECRAAQQGKEHLELERWNPDSRKGTIEQLPKELATKASMPGLEAVTARDVYVDFGGADTALARFDGTSWKTDKLPPGKLGGFAVGADGAWTIVGKKLFHRGKDSQWHKQTLPRGAGGARLVPSYIVPRSGGLPWVVADEPHGEVLLGAKPAKPEAVVDLPTWDNIAFTFGEDSMGMMPASGACEHLFVVLQYGVGATQKTFKVLDALKGQPGLGKVQIVVDDSSGQLLLGAVVPDWATAKRVEALAKQKSRLVRMACHTPKVKRKVPL